MNRNANNSFQLKEVIKTLSKRIKFLLTLYFIGIIIAIICILIINYYYKPYYNTDFSIKSEIITAKETAVLIEDLSLLKHDKNQERFCEALNIEEKVANEIMDIKTPIIIKDNVQILDITFTTYSPDIITPATKGVINYLNNIPFIKNSLENKKNHLQSFLKELDVEIKEIINTKKIIQNNLANPKVSQPLIVVPTFSNIHLISLKEKRTETLIKIDSLQGFMIVKEPLVQSQPIQPNNIKNFILANIIIILFSIVLTVYQKQT